VSILQQQEGQTQHVRMQLQEQRKLFISCELFRVLKLRRRELQLMPLIIARQLIAILLNVDFNVLPS